MKIAKWGNSLAVRIPADVAKALDLKAGDEIDLARGDGSRVEIKRRAAAVASLRRFRGLLPTGSFDRDAANGR